MKTFTIDTENNITIHASKKAAKETGASVFASEDEFAELVGSDGKRLVAIWNTLPGATPVKKFKDCKTGVARIWKQIQSLGASASGTEAEEHVIDKPEPTLEAAPEVTIEAGTPQTAAVGQTNAALPAEVSESAAQVKQEAPEVVASGEPISSVDTQATNAPATATEPSKQARRAKKASKVPKVAEAAKSESGPREGSKTAKVVAMLQREGGATLTEIMTKMGWQKHTVRGFMAGTMKKAGFSVESFKPEGGERTYRINK